MDDSDYGSMVLSETARRAWAVEQAVAAVTQGSVFRGDTSQVADAVEGIAASFLNYLSIPQRSADDRLLAAARAYDGRTDAAPLIGALADALERMVRGG